MVRPADFFGPDSPLFYATMAVCLHLSTHVKAPVLQENWVNILVQNAPPFTNILPSSEVNHENQKSHERLGYG